MKWTRRRKYTLLLIGMVIGATAFGGAPVLGAIMDSLTPTTGGGVVQAPDGPKVTLTNDADIYLGLASEVVPFDNTVELTTDQGNVTLQSNGKTNVSFAPSEITGTWTNATAIDASGAALTIDPEDKAKLTVDGAATEVAFSDYGIDNANTDLVITGPDGTSSDVTFYNLPDGNDVTAIDTSNNKPVATGEVNEFGQLTLSIEHSTRSLKLVSGDQTNAPEQSDPSPTNDLSTPPSELSVNVSDADFPEDTVTVNVSYDGTEINNTTLSSNGAVTAPLDNPPEGGSHQWTVRTEDEYGNVNEKQYDFRVPTEIYIYNVTPNASNQYELLTSDVNVTATIAGSGETVKRVSVSDGKIDFTGLPPEETYVITLEADGYHTRSVYVPSLYEQSQVFMLNTNVTSVQNQINIEDRTGRYSDNPALQVQRVINQSNVTETNETGYQWVTVSGNTIGATDFIVANLEQDQQYRFVIQNQEGDKRVLGTYLAQESGTITLDIGAIEFNAEVEEGVAFQATMDRQTVNETSGATARFLRLITVVGDTEATELQYRVVRADVELDIIVPETSITLGDRQTIVTHNLSALDPSAPEDQGYKVEYEIVKPNADNIEGERYVGTMAPLGFGLDSSILSLIGWVALVAFAGFTALQSPKMSVTGTPIMAAGFTMFGIVNIPTVLLVLAGTIGVFYLVGEARGR